MQNEQDPNTEAAAPEVEATQAEPPAPAAAEPEAAPDGPEIPAEIYEQITNPELNEEQRDQVARSMMATEQRLQGTMNAGLQMGAGMGLFEMIQQFFGMGDGGGNVQNIASQVMAAFQNGDLTTAGEMPAGSVLEGLAADAMRMAPQQPAPQAPNTAPQQNPNLMTPGMGGPA